MIEINIKMNYFDVLKTMAVSNKKTFFLKKKKNCWTDLYSHCYNIVTLAEFSLLMFYITRHSKEKLGILLSASMT